MASLQWLEALCPPVIALPRMEEGQDLQNFVPNNDLDAVQGDVRRIGKIRRKKRVRPLLFNAQIPLLYAWRFEPSEDGQRHAGVICDTAERLYQFGRGWDMAWAWGEVLAESKLEERLLNHPGNVYRPSTGGAGKALPCPTLGTLDSLMRRYAANTKRFRTEKSGRTVRSFSQQPKAQFAQIPYDSPSTRHLYELREQSREARFAVWPLERTVRLVEALRDGATARLRKALPTKGQEIERVLVGRKANGDDAGRTSLRVKIVPLPSIGHRHADRGIRRVLVEVPADCPLRADDINWAFAGQEIAHPLRGMSMHVTPTEAKEMLKHYGFDERSQVWRTVTPVALPESARRRRIDPSRIGEQAKGSAERRAEQERATEAVFQVLRHAQVRCRPGTIQVQREPFEANGQSVEAFAKDTRFAKQRLWHVQIRFRGLVSGPLVIGDGRFLGLGVMAPVHDI